MLLQYGNTICPHTWKIDEKTAVGYSRLYYVYGGEVLYKDDDKKCYLKTGNLYIFPSSLAYSMRQNIQNPLNCTYMHIDYFPSIVNELIEIQVERFTVLKHLLCAVSESINENNTRLVNALADAFMIFCNQQKFVSLPIAQVSRVLQYIADHIAEDISVGKLSSLAGYNEQYFIRLFKQNVGLTPYQYIVSYRLKEGRRMLKTNMSISDIAARTGYNDVKSYSRAFKSSFGVSPTEYRRNYIGQP